MKFVKINAPLGLHFKLFLKKKEKLLKKKKQGKEQWPDIWFHLQRKWGVLFFFSQSIDFCFWSVLATVHMQFTHFKHTNLQALIQSWVTIAPIFTPSTNLCPLAVTPHSLLPPTLATTNLLSIPMDLALPCKWNEPINVCTVLDYSLTWVIGHNEKSWRVV